jgi:hypothetical protein
MAIPKWWFWTWVVLLSMVMTAMAVAGWNAGGWVPLGFVLLFTSCCACFVRLVWKRWVY